MCKRESYLILRGSVHLSICSLFNLRTSQRWKFRWSQIAPLGCSMDEQLAGPFILAHCTPSQCSGYLNSLPDRCCISLASLYQSPYLENASSTFRSLQTNFSEPLMGRHVYSLVQAPELAHTHPITPLGVSVVPFGTSLLSWPIHGLISANRYLFLQRALSDSIYPKMMLLSVPWAMSLPDHCHHGSTTRY